MTTGRLDVDLAPLLLARLGGEQLLLAIGVVALRGGPVPGTQQVDRADARRRQHPVHAERWQHDGWLDLVDAALVVRRERRPFGSTADDADHYVESALRLDVPAHLPAYRRQRDLTCEHPMVRRATCGVDVSGSEYAFHGGHVPELVGGHVAWRHYCQRHLKEHKPTAEAAAAERRLPHNDPRTGRLRAALPGMPWDELYALAVWHWQPQGDPDDDDPDTRPVKPARLQLVR